MIQRNPLHRRSVVDWLFNRLTRGRLDRLEQKLEDTRRRYIDGSKICDRLRNDLRRARDESHAERRRADNLAVQLADEKKKVEATKTVMTAFARQYADLLNSTHHLAVHVEIEAQDEQLPYDVVSDAWQHEANQDFAAKRARQLLADVMSDSANAQGYWDVTRMLYVGTATTSVFEFFETMKTHGGEVYEVNAETAKASTARDPLVEAHGGAVEVEPAPLPAEFQPDVDRE